MQVAAQLGKYLFVWRHPPVTDIRLATRPDPHHGKTVLLLPRAFVTLHYRHAAPVLGQNHGRLILQGLDPTAGITDVAWRRRQTLTAQGVRRVFAARSGKRWPARTTAARPAPQ